MPVPHSSRWTGSAGAPAATITDALHRPLRDLRISVTDRCNFRCEICGFR